MRVLLVALACLAHPAYADDDADTSMVESAPKNKQSLRALSSLLYYSTLPSQRGYYGGGVDYGPSWGGGFAHTNRYHGGGYGMGYGRGYNGGYGRGYGGYGYGNGYGGGYNRGYGNVYGYGHGNGQGYGYGNGYGHGYGYGNGYGYSDYGYGGGQYPHRSHHHDAPWGHHWEDDY